MSFVLNQQPRPFRLSVVMMVKNEAKNLAISLPALKGWIDELIVLDSGSTDDSRQLVESAGGQWFVNTNWQGFGKQRQLAQSYATGDWVLALDADEEITPQLKQSILDVIVQPPANIVYGIKRIDCIFGHEIDNSYWALKAHWRLYPKTFQYNDNLVHESVELNGAVTQTLKGTMLHHTADTPQFWLDKRLQYAKAWAVDRHQRGKNVSIFSVILHANWAFIKQNLVDGRLLKGRYGFVYSLLFTQYTF
ncbi:MAG: glycosyltransferase family 2 protein, partial [Acinetobacter sp.]|nr:glycosyltransferase family 2 protein [Acinetobacter sp.]